MVAPPIPDMMGAAEGAAEAVASWPRSDSSAGGRRGNAEGVVAASCEGNADWERVGDDRPWLPATGRDAAVAMREAPRGPEWGVGRGCSSSAPPMEWRRLCTASAAWHEQSHAHAQATGSLAMPWIARQ